MESETIAGEPLATTRLFARSLQRSLWQQHFASQTITVKTTAPELSIPADYTAECSDELILDDATATDNCGEVTIEVSSETTAGDCDGSYTVTRTFTATDDAGNSTPPLKPSRLRTRQLLSSRAFLPTTRWSALTRCPWTMQLRQTTAAM